jgi:Kef-type K+ transport system membrane component KefB
MHSVARPLVTSAGRTELLLVTVIIQLIIMVSGARVMNIVFHRLGQPGVVGEIVAWLMLGPSLLGYFCPSLTTQLAGAPMQLVLLEANDHGLKLRTG